LNSQELPVARVTPEAGVTGVTPPALPRHKQQRQRVTDQTQQEKKTD